MAIDFPSSPTNGQIVTVSGKNWVYQSSNSSWVAQNSTSMLLNVQTVASATTVTPTFTNDAVTITAQAAALTLANWSGTATNFWGMVIRIKDNGTARAITYGTNYAASDGVTLPTTTTVGKTYELAFVHNTVTGKHVLISAVTY